MRALLISKQILQMKEKNVVVCCQTPRTHAISNLLPKSLHSCFRSQRIHRAVQENRKGLGFKLTQGAWIETCHRALCIKMAADGKLFVRFCSLFVLLFVIVETKDEDADRAKEKEAAEKEKKYNAIDTVFLLVMMFLLIITVLTVWLFKVKRFRFLHETGVCMIYGKLVAPVVFQWIFILHCKVLDWLFLGDHVAHLEFVKTLLQFQFISFDLVSSPILPHFYKMKRKLNLWFKLKNFSWCVLVLECLVCWFTDQFESFTCKTLVHRSHWWLI